MSAAVERSFDKWLFGCLFLGFWSIIVVALSFWAMAWYLRSPLSMYSEANRVIFESLEFADALREAAPTDGNPIPLSDIAEVLRKPEFAHLREYGFKPLPEGPNVIATLVVNRHYEILFFGSGHPSIHNRNIQLQTQ